MSSCQTEKLNVREEIAKLSPPDYWEREIYEEVAVLRRPLAGVASAFQLDKAGVRQAVAKVSDWLMNADDDEAGDLPPAQARRLASRLVRMRLERLLTMSMEAYEHSQGDFVVHKRRDKGIEQIVETTTTTCHGDVRYLTHYRQVALTLARLDGVCLRPQVEVPQREDGEAREAWTAARQRQEQASQRRDALLEGQQSERDAENRRHEAQKRLLPDERRRELVDLVRLADAEAARPSGTASEEDLAALARLYPKAQAMLAADRTAREVLGLSLPEDATYGAAAERKVAGQSAAESQKTPYNSTRPADSEAPAGERRRTFLSGAPLADAA